MEDPNITLARNLWTRFIYADTSNEERLKQEWDNQSKEYRDAWIRVAELVSNLIQETIIIYGYNGKEPYESELDKLISKGNKR